MSYYHWLGHESDELDEYMKAMVWERHEIERHQHECKPEADGFITVYPKVKRNQVRVPISGGISNGRKGWMTI